MNTSDRFENPPPYGEPRRAPTARELALRAELIQVRHELKLLLEDIERTHQPASSGVQSAVVTAVVNKTVLMHQAIQRQD